MRRIATFLILGFLFIPNLTFAATEACSKKGYTIATVNGVFTDQKGAEANLRALKDIGGQEYKGEIVEYQYFLNASHLAGLGDGLKAFKQKVEDGVAADDYDLIEMVKDASAKVTTRKLLLVAHSQGNFYANSFYEKVTGKDTPSSRGLDTSPLKRGRGGGVPLESIGMYSVATPSNHVSGGGTYLTSTSDKVIAGVVGSMPLFKIMTPNTDIELKEGDDTWGHNFSDVYLKYRAAQIVSDIEWSLGRLKADDTTPPQSSPLKRGGGEDTTTPDPSSPTTPPSAPLLGQEGTRGGEGPCIDPPELTLAHKAVGVAFAVADPYAHKLLIETPVGIHDGSVAILNTGTSVVLGIGNATTKTATLAATGIASIGNAVGNTAAGTVAMITGAGKFMGGVLAGIFGGTKGQIAAVAVATAGEALSVRRADIGNIIDTNENKGEENTPPRLEDAAPLLGQGGEEDTPPESLPAQASSPLKRGGGEEEVQAPEPEKNSELPKAEVSPPKEPPKVEVKASVPPPSSIRLSPAGGGGGGISNPARTEQTTNNSQPATDTSSVQSTPSADTTAPAVPVITSPTSGSTSLTTTNVTFVGTAEASAVISTDFSSATTSAAGGGAWSLSLTLSQGTSTIQFFATDASNNRSLATTTSIFVDSVAPDATASVTECTNTISSETCLLMSTALSLSWASVASDFAYFIVSQNGTVSTTTATSTSAVGTDGETYTLSVSAVDQFGNQSATSTQTVEVFATPIVVSEIAWAGTAAHGSDEWVELYNRTSRAISLSGWTLYATTDLLTLTNPPN